jgi:hypothetical protein
VFLLSGCEYGGVKLESGIGYIWDGSGWDEINGHHFWDNNNGATAVCEKLGYTSGTVVMNLNQEAPGGAFCVGKCDAVSDFPTCSRKSDCIAAGSSPMIKIICDGDNSITAASCLALPPTQFPSDLPTLSPTPSPTDLPTSSPTPSPTDLPTSLPTPDSPTVIPTVNPSSSPIPEPTLIPSYGQSKMPTPRPSNAPTFVKSDLPTVIPSLNPSITVPTAAPTAKPTDAPTEIGCVVIKEWTQARAEQLCPGHTHHAYGVELCDTYDNPDYRRRLGFALANQLWSSCSHTCIYDYDSYNTERPHAFRWVGKCYNVATGYFCIDDEVNEMEQSHKIAATLCEFSTPCVERIVWTQEVAESNCPDGYGGSGNKGWGTANVCPKLVRLENGFYERADVLYQGSFNISLANHIFRSCSAKCVYDIENEGVVYQWKGECWEMQTNWACITVHTSEYAWAKDYISKTLCPVPTSKSELFQCVERQQEWNNEISLAICGNDDMGSTNKSSDAMVCAGFEDFQYRLDKSLANRVFLACDAWCVYDIYKGGYEAFSWRSADLCWKPVTSGLCINGNPSHVEKITDYIENTLCESITPEPTEAPTCITQQEWSEDLMDEYCSVVDTGSTYKHYNSTGRAAIPCPGFEFRESHLLKSLAMRMFSDCSSWCIYDYYSNGAIAWKWSSNGLCWNPLTRGSCHWDYAQKQPQAEWLKAKESIKWMCTYSPTVSPTDCMPNYIWDEKRAEELCPSTMDAFPASKSYGVEVCDDAKSVTRKDNLEASLANNFFTQCSSHCVYDYDTIINNIRTGSSDYGGFIWKDTCYKWVTGWYCFTNAISQFEEVSQRAKDLCSL